MKRLVSLVAVVLLLSLTGTAFAGHGHKKCTEDTDTCLNNLAAKIQKKGWLGVDLDATESGHYKITSVVPDSPAEAAGFRAGDVLVALNGIALTDENQEALKKVKKSFAPEHAVTYTVKRSGAKQQLAVTLGHVPARVMAEWIGQHMLEHHTTVVVASAH